jgi:hypothetical protein
LPLSTPRRKPGSRVLLDHGIVTANFLKMDSGLRRNDGASGSSRAI